MGPRASLTSTHCAPSIFPLPSPCLLRDFGFLDRGSYTYDIAPSTYHDWEFRTSITLKLYEDAIRSKSKKAKGDPKSIDPDDSDDDSRAEAPLGLLLHLYPQRTGPTWMQPLHQQTAADLQRDRALAHRSQMTRVLPKASQLHCRWTNRRPTLSRRGRRWSTEFGRTSRRSLRTCERYRQRIFHCTRWFIRNFITQLRNVVFPRAAEEPRELFRAANGTVFSHAKAASQCCRTSSADDVGGSC